MQPMMMQRRFLFLYTVVNIFLLRDGGNNIVDSSSIINSDIISDSSDASGTLTSVPQNNDNDDEMTVNTAATATRTNDGTATTTCDSTLEGACINSSNNNDQQQRDDNNDDNKSTTSSSYCTDNHKMCEHWSNNNQCEENYSYMKKNCRKSCNLCNSTVDDNNDNTNSRSAITNNEQDNDNRLVLLSANDKEMLMKESEKFGVRQSLGSGSNSGDIVKALQETISYMNDVVYNDPAYAKVKADCQNRHHDCSFWKSIGECNVNPNYMKIQCAPSCKSCQDILFETRCPFNRTELEKTNIWTKDDLNAMFINITTNNNDLSYKPTILSKPKDIKLPEKGGEEENNNKESSSSSWWQRRFQKETGKDDIPDGPWVVILDDFLTENECLSLIELGYKQKYERSTGVGKRNFDGTYEKDVITTRTSTNAWCQDECYENQTSILIQEKITNLTGIPRNNSEYLQLLRYEETQHYKTHHDYIQHEVERQQGPRMITVFLYLNDVEQGGGTNFPNLKLTVQPKMGRAVIWPSVTNDNPEKQDSRTYHEALPVEKGIKYGANAWLHLRNVKDPLDTNCAA